MRTFDGRPLTEDERRGYELACETLETWGAMIHRAGRELAGSAGDTETVPLSELMAQKGRLVSDLARAARLQAGCEIIFAPAPAETRAGLH